MDKKAEIEMLEHVKELHARIEGLCPRVADAESRIGGLEEQHKAMHSRMETLEDDATSATVEAVAERIKFSKRIEALEKAAGKVGEHTHTPDEKPTPKPGEVWIVEKKGYDRHPALVINHLDGSIVYCCFWKLFEWREGIDLVIENFLRPATTDEAKKFWEGE